MQTAPLKQISQWIQQQKTFEAIVLESNTYIRIDEYPPYLCIALHDGSSLRPSLEHLCLLSAEERRYEEDPHTAQMISSMPIILASIDSRYEYDLNRSPEQCLYTKAWGKDIWKNPLNEEEKNASLKKHQSFYALYHNIVKYLEELHGRCLVFDIHSYNTERLNRDDWPHFNIGTQQLARHRFRGTIKTWIGALQGKDTNGQEYRIRENDVFQGLGYLATYSREHFKNTLVLPTDIGKFYCEEENGQPYPLVFRTLSEHLKQAIIQTVQRFTQRSHKALLGKSDLLSNQIDPSVLQLDKALYRLARNIDVLDHVNPINLAEVKRKFFSSGYKYLSNFHYSPLKLDPFRFKESLYRLPIDNISDITLQQLYRDVIDSYADKAEQLSSIGSERFLYNSLRYYGEPSQADIDNANFLLHCAPLNDEDIPETINAEEIRKAFLDAMHAMNLQGTVKISNRLVAKAMVSGKQKAVLINKNAYTHAQHLQGLIHHELGVHLVTTRNAERQALKLFLLGLPLNTHTQEGLAILAEYFCGGLSLKRLKGLAVRVLIIQQMIAGTSFKDVFQQLIEDYGFSRDAAFSATVRGFRGGGFTKDYLYLRGFKDCLKLYRQEDNIDALFVGKTSLNYIEPLKELVDRKILTPPHHIPPAMKMTPTERPVIDHLIHSLK